MIKLKNFFAVTVLVLAFAAALTACKDSSNELPAYPASTSEKSGTESSNSTSKIDGGDSNTNSSKSTTSSFESATQSSSTDNEESNSKGSENSVSVPEKSDTGHDPAAGENIVSIKTANDSIEYALKKILLRAETFEELNRDLENSEYAKRIKGVRAQEYYKGPEVAAGKIKDGMVIFVDYDDDCWVRYVKSQLFDSSKVTIWDGGEFDSGLYYICIQAKTIESLYHDVKEYDVNERVDYVRVYKNHSDYDNGIYITDAKGDLEVGMIIEITYDSESSHMRRTIAQFPD